MAVLDQRDRMFVDGTRLLGGLDQLRQIGGTADGGVQRVAFSAEDVEGREFVLTRMAEAGLDTGIDGTLRGTCPNCRRSWSGRMLGWSFGGLVAHEIAVRLRAAGEQVDLLALLDSYPLMDRPAGSTATWSSSPRPRNGRTVSRSSASGASTCPER
jgi:Thioesterase domain